RPAGPARSAYTPRAASSPANTSDSPARSAAWRRRAFPTTVVSRPVSDRRRGREGRRGRRGAGDLRATDRRAGALLVGLVRVRGRDRVATTTTTLTAATPATGHRAPSTNPPWFVTPAVTNQGQLARG